MTRTIFELIVWTNPVVSKGVLLQKPVPLSVLIVLVSVNGCGGDDGLDAQNGVDVLENTLGGPVGLADFVNRSPERSVIDTFSEYQVGYTESTMDNDIAGCPTVFESENSTSYHAFGGEYYYIDDSGRPDRVFVSYPPIAPEERARTCQGNVGRWGDDENSDNDYDGGHLIGSQLGGWGARANLVPQDTNFNRGQYVRLENKIADCGNLAEGQLFYYVRVKYKDLITLIPDRYTIILHDQTTGNEIELNLVNVDEGGENGKEQVSQALAFLEDMGCL